MADIGARNERRRGGTPAPAVLFPSADGIRKQFKGTKVRSVWEALVVGPARSVPFLLVPKPYPRAGGGASASVGGVINGAFRTSERAAKCNDGDGGGGVGDGDKDDVSLARFESGEATAALETKAKDDFCNLRMKRKERGEG